jgi:hypothetical protein
LVFAKQIDVRVVIRGDRVSFDEATTMAWEMKMYVAERIEETKAQYGDYASFWGS